MASLFKTKGKSGTTWRIDFLLGSDRNTVRLGKMTKQQAETVKSRVEFLISAKDNGTAPDEETSRWVASIGNELHAKLARHGLVAPRVKAEITKLKAFLDAYVAKRSDVKGSTATIYGHTRRCLIEYFGVDKLLGEITFTDAQDWRLWLARAKDDGGQELADNTVRRRCGIARQFFLPTQSMHDSLSKARLRK